MRPGTDNSPVDGEEDHGGADGRDRDTGHRRQAGNPGFVNAYAEVGGTDHPAVDVIRAEKTWTRELFAGLAREAGLADPDRVATELHLLYEGATVIATAGGDPAVLTAARAAAVRVVDGA